MNPLSGECMEICCDNPRHWPYDMCILCIEAFKQGEL